MIRINLFGLTFIINRKHILVSLLFIYNNYGNTAKKNIIKSILTLFVIIKYFSKSSNISFITRHDLCLQYEYREHLNSKKYQLVHDDNSYLFCKNFAINPTNMEKYNNEISFYKDYSHLIKSFSFPDSSFVKYKDCYSIECSIITNNYSLYPKSKIINNYEFLSSFIIRSSINKSSILLNSCCTLNTLYSDLLSNYNVDWLFSPVHGDLSSDNIYYNKKSNRYLLIDFENFCFNAPYLTDVVCLVCRHLYSKKGLSFNVEDIYDKVKNTNVQEIIFSHYFKLNMLLAIFYLFLNNNFIIKNILRSKNYETFVRQLDL